MFLTYKNLLFFFTLIFSTLMVVSSSSWFTCWLGLEFNLISLIPLLSNKLNFKNTEASIKYFIVQAMSSMIIMFTSIFMFKSTPFNFLSISNEVIIMSLALKSGIAPFHFWFPQVIDLINWSKAFIILTWQKISPLVMIQFSSSWLLIYFIVVSALVGSMGAINTNSIKKIMVFSSISHSSWMLTIINFNETFWWIYFLTYSTITLSLIVPLSFFDMTLLSQIYFSKIFYPVKMMIFYNFFSLAGLPPFTGFFIKLIILISLLFSLTLSWVILLILVASTVVSLYYYFKPLYFLMMICFNKNFIISLNLNGYTNSLMNTVLFLSIFLNLFISLFF